MPDNQKITLLQQKLEELTKFRDQQRDFDVEKFQILRKEISSMLDESYRRKFDSLIFYEIINDEPPPIDIDSVPF